MKNSIWKRLLITAEKIDSNTMAFGGIMAIEGIVRTGIEARNARKDLLDSLKKAYDAQERYVEVLERQLKEAGID